MVNVNYHIRAVDSNIDFWKYASKIRPNKAKPGTELLFCLKIILYQLTFEVFVIKSRRRLFPSKKQNPLPIIKNLLEKIIEKKPLFIFNFNVDTIFEVA